MGMISKRKAGINVRSGEGAPHCRCSDKGFPRGRSFQSRFCGGYVAIQSSRRENAMSISTASSLVSFS